MRVVARIAKGGVEIETLLESNSDTTEEARVIQEDIERRLREQEEEAAWREYEREKQAEAERRIQEFIERQVQRTYHS